MPAPYAHIGTQNHELTIGRASDHHPDCPHITVAADNRANGGDHVSVWLLPEQASALGRALDARAAFEVTDHTGDTLTVEPADDWTTFELTRVPREDDEEPATVRFVVLSSGIPGLRAALVAAVEGDPAAEQAAAEFDAGTALLAGEQITAFAAAVRKETLAEAADSITALGKARGWSIWAADFIHPDREFVDTAQDDDQAEAEQPQRPAGE